MADWRFFLDGIETQREPVNWDAFEYTLSRSDEALGIESTFASNKLTFWPEDSVYLISKFNELGFDGVVKIKIQALCGNKVIDEINGEINLITYSEQNRQVSVTFDEGSFSRKFKNRKDVQVNFDQNLSVDGVALPDADYFDLKLHSKEIRRQGKMYACNYPAITQFKTGDGLNDLFNSQEYYVLPLFDQLVTDVPTFVLPTVDYIHAESAFLNILSQNPLLTSPTGGTYKISIQVDSEVQTQHHLKTILELRVGTGVDAGATRISQTIATNLSAGSGSFAIINSFTETYTLFPGEGLWIFYATTFTGVLGDTALTYKLLVNSGQITIEDQKTTFTPTDCKAIDVFNAFKRITQSITGQEDCFRSNYFGRPDIYPFPQSAGCGAYLAIANGLNIRNMLDKNGKKFPISMSWNDLYDAVDAVFGIGMSIEYNSYGKGFIRVENVEYYYSNDVVSTFFEVPDIARDVATNSLINSVEIGYAKWNLNQGGLNGIDEFNAAHQYSLSVINSQKKLSKISKFHASGYLIELTRREQYLKNTKTGKTCELPTAIPNYTTPGNQLASGQNDFETDNDNFFICTNMTDIPYSSVPTSTYTKPTTSKYKRGTISERNENFAVVGNLISPETAYNLRISPKRNLLRWYPYIAISLVGKQNPAIKFVSGQGNFQEYDKYASNLCDSFGGAIVHQDFNVHVSDVASPEPLYRPMYLSFEAPLTFLEFLNIRKNSNKAIQVSCSYGPLSTGFLVELNYLPNKEGGVGQFKILSAACNNGSFNSGFSNAFDIGTC